MKTKPFNLEAFKNGAPALLDDSEIQYITSTTINNVHVHIVTCKMDTTVYESENLENLRFINSEGYAVSSYGKRLPLRKPACMAPNVIEGWLNVYKTNGFELFSPDLKDVMFRMSYVFPTKEQADRSASKERVACVPIKIEL